MQLSFVWIKSELELLLCWWGQQYVGACGGVAHVFQHWLSSLVIIRIIFMLTSLPLTFARWAWQSPNARLVPFSLFFPCDNPKGTRVHKSNSRITAREGRGVPVKLKETGKDQSKVERPAGSAAFWLALSANRLNQGEEVRCPTQWVVMMGNA